MGRQICLNQVSQLQELTVSAFDSWDQLLQDTKQIEKRRRKEEKEEREGKGGGKGEREEEGEGKGDVNLSKVNVCP